jgi:hypothetical protein
MLLPGIAMKRTLTSLSAGAVVADGTEQILLEIHPPYPMTISGYVDLVNLIAGDTVNLSLYIQMRSGAAWQLYDEETYSGVQSNPLIHILDKPVDYGYKFTLKQTAGVFRNFAYEFLSD